MKKKSFDSSVNVLVLGAGGNVSIGIIRTLKSIKSINAKIYGACINKDSAGFGLCDYSLISPMASSENFHDWLDFVEKQHSIDVVLSGVEEVNIILSERLLRNNEIIYLVPDREHMDCFSDKLKTSEWLLSHNLNAPVTYELNLKTDIHEIFEKMGKPFIIKPRFGKGSQGVHVIYDLDQFMSFSPFDDFVAQEYIGNEDSEFTCGVYSTSKTTTEVIVLKRRLKNGSTSVAEVVFHPEIEEYCKKISKALNAESPFNVQLRLSDVDKKPYCFEINMRLSGTTFIRHSLGFPDCEAWLLSKLKPEIKQPEFLIRRAKAIRYESEVFVDVGCLDSVNDISAVHVKGLKT